ncbi:nucleotidyltransferase family protein [uncultured Lamprocystis sp.]|jgi:hypothetical protein|uniref:nucleotidyltransferase family protein n=2 Tax=uncultured Lamprocystis sp. TaxID=543132 RepID=UPI00345B897B
MCREAIVIVWPPTIALAPLVRPQEALPWLSASDALTTTFGQMLAAQGLSSLWYELVTRNALQGTGGLGDILRNRRLAAAASYRLQHRTVIRVGTCLNQEDIPCALIKGAAVREKLYVDPSVRPADDIDIVVAAEHRDAAIRALCGYGMTFSANRDNVSHAATLLDGPVAVDLHWHVLRPGRSRFDLVPTLLETVGQERGLPLLGDDANLLVLLVHPAFAKYVNGCTAKLIRVIDLDRMLRTTQPDWDWILPLIGAAGLRTAAWAVLHWQRSLLDTPVDPTVLRYLEPGRLQRRYLTSWIDHRLTARLNVVPGLVQWAFTLALHERPGDALRFILQRAKARLEAGSILKHLQQIGRTPG